MRVFETYSGVQNIIYKQRRHDLVCQSRFPNEPDGFTSATSAYDILFTGSFACLWACYELPVRALRRTFRYSSYSAYVLNIETFGLRSFRLRDVCHAYSRYFVRRNVNYPLALARCNLDLWRDVTSLIPSVNVPDSAHKEILCSHEWCGWLYPLSICLWNVKEMWWITMLEFNFLSYLFSTWHE